MKILVWMDESERESTLVTKSGSRFLVVMQKRGVGQNGGGMQHGCMGDDLGGGGLVDDGIEAIVVVGGVVNGAHRTIGLNQGVLAWKRIQWNGSAQ